VGLRTAAQWTRLEKKSLALMVAVVVLWSTDFVHHIAPSMIGLGFGLLAVMPFMRILACDDFRKLNFLHIFYVAAAIGMGNVLSATKGLAVLTNSVLAGLEPLLTNRFLVAIALYW